MSGCGGKLSDSEISQGWGATFHVINLARAQAGYTASQAVNKEAFDCPEGGKLSLRDTESSEGDVERIESQIVFNGCKAMGVEVNGDLKLAIEIGASTSRWAYKGGLAWSGAVDGNCSPIDMEQTLSATTGRVEIKGQMCGQSASSVVNTMPR